jgi:hypothetical protein
VDNQVNIMVLSGSRSYAKALIKIEQDRDRLPGKLRGSGGTGGGYRYIHTHPHTAKSILKLDIDSFNSNPSNYNDF